MRRAARTRDDDLDAARLGRFGEFEQEIWRPLSRDDLCLMLDAKLGQRLRGDLHRRPVRFAAHNYGN